MGAMLNLAGMFRIGQAGGTREAGSCKIPTLPSLICSLVSVCHGCSEQVDVRVAWNKHNSSVEGTFLLGFLSNLLRAGNTESIPLAGDAKELNNL